eukprot:scaffold421244_cov58-Attheya_sp.AAC.11
MMMRLSLSLRTVTGRSIPVSRNRIIASFGTGKHTGRPSSFHHFHPVQSTHQEQVVSFTTKLFGDTNDDDNDNEKYQDVELDMQNVYREWTLEQDRLLMKHRHESMPRLASMLGRGLQGVKARLSKLTDVNSPAYERLFVSSSSRGNNENDDESNDKNRSDSGGLKPAGEVLRRFRWDPAMQELWSDFSLLHFDRVDEIIVETPFDAPNNSIKGKETLFAFALPEHRIVGFKYKERVVWDRETRTDLVFGSQNGNGVTIDSVIQNYDEWDRARQEELESQRKRQAEVSRRIKLTLGDDRFQQLKQLSGSVQQIELDDAPTVLAQKEIEEYVRVALNLFRQSRQEASDSFQKNTEIINDDDMIPSNDVEALELLSELVALLQYDEMRERILLEIEQAMDRLVGGGGKKSTSPKKSVMALPELEESDLTETFVRGSGPGGQKINKTSNRVILVHEPTQLRVECQDTRSLTQNRKMARKRLRLKLDEFLHGTQSRAGLQATKIAKRKSKLKSRNKAREQQQKKQQQEFLDPDQD